MFLFILGIIVALAGIGIVIYGTVTHDGPVSVVGVVALIVAIGLVVWSLFASVPTGYTGILTTFGKVNDNTLEAGINVKAPWQSVVLMDNREQTENFSVLAFSADIQEVKVSGTISYSIDKATAMKLYRDIGKKYYETLVTPRLNESIKVLISSYSAEELITNRGALSSALLNAVNASTSQYGLNIINIAMDVDFADAFTDAVEAKQVATQVLQKAQTEQDQKTMEAQQQAERQKIEAQAKADIAKLEADANAYAAKTKADAEAYGVKMKGEAEAEANAKISESLTEELLEYVKNSLWNGQLPSTYIGDDYGVLPIIDAQ